MPEIALKLGSDVIERYKFDKDVISIGRARDNDVVVENLSVSRNHARIKRQDGRYVLTDLNSANGTYVNGVRISKTEIVDGDNIILGKHTLEFRNTPATDDELIVDSLGADRTIVVDRASSIGHLVVTEGRLKGKEFPLSKMETVIGKGSNADIVFTDDWFLSKRQAIIRLKAGSYELEDLGSFRKTKLNGGPIPGPTTLKAGNVIEFGATRCVFEMRSAITDRAATGRVPREIAADDSVFSGVEAYREDARQPTKEEVVLVPEEPTVKGGNILDSLDDIPAFKSDEPTRDGVATPIEETPPAQVAPVPPLAQTSKKKKRRGRGPDSEYRTVEFSKARPSAAQSDAEADDDSQPAPAPQPASAAVITPQPAEANSQPVLPINATNNGDGKESEIEIWEKALQNRSPVIRKQAERRLKELTGRDYAT